MGLGQWPRQACRHRYGWLTVLKWPILIRIDTLILDMSQTAPCENCGEEIKVDINECPECGNNPRKKAKWAGIGITLVGVVTAPFMIGIPIILVGIAALIGLRFADYPPADYAF